MLKFSLILFLFSGLVTFSQSKRTYLDSLYKIDKSIFINNKVQLKTVFDSCYIHYYNSRAHFFNSNISKSESEFFIFISKAKTLPDFEDLVALSLGANMCMLFMENSRNIKDKVKFNKWKTKYLKTKPHIHSCVRSIEKGPISTEWVYKEMINRAKRLNDVKNLKYYTKKRAKLQQSNIRDFFKY